ncbi:MAG TPA: GNAT family protein [Xanthomonadaceae bacterium]|nr:GNAT family protein [Xanthomonadaceae bacterium]
MSSIVLAGYGVRLEPLTVAHADDLLAAAADGALWTLNYTAVPGPDLASARDYIRVALEGRASGTMLPFVVVAEGSIVGCTRYYDIDPSVPTLAIGYTWYAARVQRTHVNTACKRLLLGHAFEAMGMRTVYFHTSHLNLRSQAAIERLGAQRDGVIRQHRRHKDGSLRDTVAYSILDTEWPAIRDRLEARLQAVAAASP